MCSQLLSFYLLYFNDYIYFSSTGRCSGFNTDVLGEKDANGDIIRNWCKAGFKKEEAICFICNKTINCRQHGVTAVKRHALSKGHISNCVKVRCKDGVLKKSTQKEITTSFNICSNTLEDKKATAEVLFCLSVAAHNLPYTFSNTATTIFPKMFVDSEIAKDFKCKSSKLSYIISDGLGPYLKQELISEISRSQIYYSVQIDETPIPQKRVQQLDILLRFFSENKDKVIVHHWETHHIGRATADNLVKCVIESLQCLPTNKLFCVFSDGPNVMKSFKNKMTNIHPELLDIGECVLHKIHNGFARGLNSFGSDIENLVVDIFYLFKRSSTQSAKLKELQVELGLPEEVFLKHVNSRWLTLQTCIQRIISQFPVLQQYFKRNTESRCDSQCMTRICEAFSDKTLFARLLFLQNASKIFTTFLTLFQAESPMIHILYDEMVNIVKTLMGRFLKEECFRNKGGEELKDIDFKKGDNWNNVDVGYDTEKAITLLNDKGKKTVVMGARSFYMTSVSYLVKVLPFHNKILKNLRFLNPSNRLDEQSVISLRFISSQLPNVVPPEEVSNVCDEYIRLQAENLTNIVTDVISFESPLDDSTDEDSPNVPPSKMFLQPIDKYWSRILKLKDVTGNFKYQVLGKVVRALLSLPHGNADIERGFSINKHMLNSRINMSIESINALRQVKSYLHFNCNNKIENFEVNTEVLKNVRASRQRKYQRLEAMKQRKKRKIDENSKTLVEDKLKDEGKELSERLKASQKMLANAEQAISSGIKKRDMTAIESGQVLLAEATSRVNEILALQEKNRIVLLKLHSGVKNRKV